MPANKHGDDEANDYSWVASRRAGNRRIVVYIVAFCLAIMLFSGWSFVRFMSERTGYQRDAAATATE